MWPTGKTGNWVTCVQEEKGTHQFLDEPRKVLVFLACIQDVFPLSSVFRCTLPNIG